MGELIATAESDPVLAFIELGLGLGRHIDGLVDAYYGPPAIKERIDAAPVTAPIQLAADARSLLSALDAGAGPPDLDPNRRRYLRAQVSGLLTVASKLAGDPISYADEVESCYGIRPTMEPEDVFEAAHRRLDEALPGNGSHTGNGSLAERLIAWREAQAVPVDKLAAAIDSLAEDLRERTDRLFGLPDGNHIDFELVTDQPWSGFNYYLGDLRSRVAINTDLPVLSTVLPHLVAHEAFPGHHTENCLKEVGLTRRRHFQEESIFCVGTPQCLLAEGLADLGLEIVVPGGAENRAAMAAEHFRSLGVPFDADTAAVVAEASDGLGKVRGNAALLLHEEGRPVEEAIAYLARWGLLPERRAAKAIEFLTDPTWRAYITCYLEGLPLCRSFVGGDPARFRRLLSEQLLPGDLAS